MKRVRSQAIQENPAVRERLLSEALRLFTSKGFAAATVREIVEGAGVTKPVLYYYFGSKEGLYLEIMGGISRLFEQRVMEIPKLSGSIRERLIHFFSGMFDGAQMNLETVKLAYSIYYGPPQGAPFIDFNRFFDTVFEMVDNLLVEGIESGEFRRVERSTLAWTLVGSYHTILEEQICRNPPRINLDGLVRVINLILDGVAGPAPPSENQGRK